MPLSVAVEDVCETQKKKKNDVHNVGDGYSGPCL
jgi:hypothetical protein